VSAPTDFQGAELDQMLAIARAAPDGYAAEVIRSALLSVGLYTLPAGGTDDQTPHDEDEVYYAVRGTATLRVGEEDHAVRPGSLLFVPAHAVHFFHDIREELVLVVFWAPPEGSATGITDGSEEDR
jgi:mannose-6-phosphate isomerase-like protein (cupin superfamily)